MSEEKIVCLSEPYVFHIMGVYLQRGFIKETSAIPILKASIKFYCKTQKPGQTYLLKVWNSIHAPIIKKALPQVKLMALTRRDNRRALISLEKLFNCFSTEFALSQWKIWPPLAFWHFDIMHLHDLCARFGARDVLDLAIISHLAWIYHFHKNQNLFDIPIIYYEDLIADKVGTLRPVFELCELSFKEFIDEAVKEFDKDSQADTIISQNAMKLVKYTELDKPRLERIKNLCDQLGIPPIEIP